MSSPIAALVYADGVYPDRTILRALDPLRDRGVQLAGVVQIGTPPGGHACDMLLQNLATGEVTAIAEDRGKHATGCRLDVGMLTELGEAVTSSLQTDAPRLLVINKFGKIEADGGGLRDAVAEAVDLGIPVLVGVPARNLDRWRAFAGSLAVELRAEAGAITAWLAGHGLMEGAPDRSSVGAGEQWTM